MRIFKDLEMVEYLGSGLPRILKAYPQDCFIFTQNFLRINFPISAEVIQQASFDSSGNPSIGGSIDLSVRQKEVLSIIKNDNKISYRAIAEKLSINDSAVKKHLNKLKEKGVLKRIGGTRGYWQISDY